MPITESEYINMAAWRRSCINREKLEFCLKSQADVSNIFFLVRIHVNDMVTYLENKE